MDCNCLHSITLYWIATNPYVTLHSLTVIMLPMQQCCIVQLTQFWLMKRDSHILLHMFRVVSDPQTYTNPKSVPL